MSASCHSMEEEWRKRIQVSPDAKDARKNLEFHRTKIQELQEELREAETYETQLEEKLNQVEDRLKPPVMRFREKLALDSGVPGSIVEEIIEEVEDPSQIIALIKAKANTMAQMTRSQLVGFIRTILNLRDAFIEQEIEAGKDVMLVSLSLLVSPHGNTTCYQEMASSVLNHLGRPTIQWSELSDWESKVFRQLIREVDGIPAFLVRLLDTILSETVRTSERTRNNEEMELN